MHIKTVILLGNFFDLVCVMLLICQQRFLFNVSLRFLFFHKERIFKPFYSWGQRFFTSMRYSVAQTKISYSSNEEDYSLAIMFSHAMKWTLFVTEFRL